MKEVFKKYAELKVLEKRIKEEMEKLNPQIVAHIDELGADKVDSDFGTFTVTKRKTWKFSDAVTSMEGTIKETKDKEKADGTATYEEMSILQFKEKKDNEI